MDDRTATGARDPLAGRLLLVTGASSGIGRAIAEAAAAAGARVALLARRRDELARLAASLPGGAAAHPVVPADVRDDDAVTAAVGAAVDGLGGLDGLVNAAGVVRPVPLLESTPADWHAMFAVNVLGLLAVTHAAVPHLIAAAAGDGAAVDLVNISSVSGRRRPNTEMSAYAATKFAVHTLSDGYREELAAHGVRTTIVSPGYVTTPVFRTGEHDTAYSEEFDARARARGMPVERVADAVVAALATPGDTMVLEIALLALAQ